MPEQEASRIRVLVVDDSSVMRRIIIAALSKHPQIEVAGFAANGLQAIAKVRELQPDVVTLDIEMPEMDGLTALQEIRKEQRLLPIIMFSSLTQANTKATIMALTAGASDYVGKPSSAAGSTDAAFEVLAAELIPKVLGLARRRRMAQATRGDASSADRRAARLTERAAEVPLRREPMTPTPLRVAAPPLSMVPASAVVVGVSTGGPMALVEIFGQLTAPLPVPVFIVQHMPATFTALLAARLTASTVMDFREPVHGETPLPGVGYMAPGGQHMLVVQRAGKTSIELSMTAPENSCRPAVDVLFRSAAEVYGSSLLAVVLTGMGTDGLKGCHAIREKNGRVLAQDEESSVVWGMPGAVVQQQLAEMVLPLKKMADELSFRTRRSVRPPANA